MVGLCCENSRFEPGRRVRISIAALLRQSTPRAAQPRPLFKRRISLDAVMVPSPDALILVTPATHQVAAEEHAGSARVASHPMPSADVEQPCSMPEMACNVAETLPQVEVSHDRSGFLPHLKHFQRDLSCGGSPEISEPPPSPFPAAKEPSSEPALKGHASPGPDGLSWRVYAGRVCVSRPRPQAKRLDNRHCRAPNPLQRRQQCFCFAVVQLDVIARC